MFGFFKSKNTEPEEEIDPMVRAQNAVDELNAAIRAIPKDYGTHKIRPWVRSGDSRYRTRAKVMLGYWCPCEQRFVVTYGEDAPGTKDY